jgi:protein-tyrosine phosphatase
MAEAVFAHKVEQAGLAEKIEIDSAGTGSWHTGEPAHHGTLEVLAKNKITRTHAARTITKSDLNYYDYILTMDEDNFRAVKYLGKSTAMIARFLDYAPSVGMREVPDPWFDGKFDRVYDMVDRAAEGLLKAILVDHFDG